MNIIYNRDLADVDWQEMKATLIRDKFHNGRTAEQLKTSFTKSYSTCTAYADMQIIDTAKALSDGVCNAYIIDVWNLTEFCLQGIARKMMEILTEELSKNQVNKPSTPK